MHAVKVLIVHNVKKLQDLCLLVLNALLNYTILLVDHFFHI